MRKQRNKYKSGGGKRLGWTTIYVFSITVAISLAAAVLFFVEQRDKRDAINAMRVQTQADLNKAALDLALLFQRNADTIRATSALISIEENVTQERFSAFSEQIFVDHDDFVLVAAAPDLVIDRVYPEKFLPGVAGTDFRAGENAQHLNNIYRAMKEKDVLFEGPVNLKSGGRGIVARNPVYLKDAEGNRKFWGITSLVIDFGKEIEAVGLDKAPFNIAIRGKDARGKHGAIFWGDRSVFSADPVYASVELPVGSWYMAAIPENGWYVPSNQLKRFHLILTVATVTILLLLIGGIRLTQLRVQANAHLYSAINSIEDGFVYFDSDDKLVIWNENYLTLHGGEPSHYTRGMRFEDMIRSDVANGHYPEAEGREEEWVQERMHNHRRRNSIVEQRLENGRWLRISESRTPEGGYVGVQMDITELRNATEEAERANRAKSEFLDVMSHELRTPLTVVLGGTPFLVKPELLPATQKMKSRLTGMGESGEAVAKDVDMMLMAYKGLAGKVERSARSLLTLINAVLDYSKIEAGRMTLDRDMAYCEDLVENVLDEFQSKAKEKGLVLEGTSSDVAIFADELRVRQVLVNIVSNAIKFTESGSITIEAEEFGDFARFRVTDTGIGVPEDRIEGVFDKFSQANSSDRRAAGGTGLGLAISKKFVEMHGGTIVMNSEEGKGTEVTFTIPKHTLQAQRNSDAKAAMPAA